MNFCRDFRTLYVTDVDVSQWIQKVKKLHFANVITDIYSKNSKRENGKETYSISMVGKKILLMQYGAPEYFKVIWKKKGLKKERENKGKKDSLWVSPWF